jgi:squalene-hopene/tetraprenyl-beta-curcumene cyclase
MKMPTPLLLLLAAIACWPIATPAQMPMDRELAVQALKHTDYGLRFLRDRQADDGSWSNSTYVTALALHAFLESYQEYNEADGAFITRPLTYLLGQAHEDGSIGGSPAQRVRDTAITLIALKATGNARYNSLLSKGRAFLADAQLDEAHGIAPTDPRYGGIADPGSGQPQLEIQYLALQALRETGLDPQSPIWDKAITYLRRASDRDTRDNATAASTLAPRAGIVGLLLAGAGVDDPSVARAFHEITARPLLDTGGPLSTLERFLFDDSLAAALIALGKSEIEQPGGNPVNWRDALARDLLARYHEDGSWGRGTGDSNLATAGALTVLNRILHSLR